MAAVLLILYVVLYLSLRPSPVLMEVAWLPNWLSEWADRHGDLRTGVPYLGASFLICLCVALYDQICPSVMMPASARRITHLILSGGGLFFLLVLTEVIQLWLPQRWPRWQDVFWGGSGILVGAILLLFAEWLWLCAVAGMRKRA